MSAFMANQIILLFPAFLPSASELRGCTCVLDQAECSPQTHLYKPFLPTCTHGKERGTSDSSLSLSPESSSLLWLGLQAFKITATLGSRCFYEALDKNAWSALQDSRLAHKRSP